MTAYGCSCMQVIVLRRSDLHPLGMMTSVRQRGGEGN